MEAKDLKQKAIEMLQAEVPVMADILLAFDKRLLEYYESLCNNSTTIDDDPNDMHNTMELLGGLKVLRLMRMYMCDYERAHDILYKYEGEWQLQGKMWKHIKGGVRHPNNTYGLSYYRLQPWQVFVLVSIFGLSCWVNTQNEAGTRELLPTEEERKGFIFDKRRLCVEFVLFTPRKTAKTQLSAFIQFIFFLEGDVNAECFCCANSESQSTILFSRTKRLIEQIDPEEKFIKATAKKIKWKDGMFRTATVTALSAGGKTKDGTQAQLCSADEYGSAGYVNGKSDMGALVSVIESSMSPRREPLTFISTTAGIVKTGPFIDKLQAIEIQLKDELEYRGEPNENYELIDSSDRHYGLLLQPDEWERTEDYLFKSVNVRRKINPMLGIIAQHSFYDDEIDKARNGGAEKLDDVLAKDFNIYNSSTKKAWITPDEIREVQQDTRIDDCASANGWEVTVGMDFSKGDDLNGNVYLAKRWRDDLGEMEYFADLDAYMSEEAVEKSTIKELLLKWAKDGWLHIVPGKTFDPAVAVNRIVELDEKDINFLSFGYDRYNAKTVVNAISQWLYDIGLEAKQLVKPVPQNFATYSPAVKAFDFMIKRGYQLPDATYVKTPMIHFSKNPLWPWEFGNCQLAVSTDGMENMKPLKANSSVSCKVDHVQMLLTALILHDAADNN